MESVKVKNVYLDNYPVTCSIFEDLAAAAAAVPVAVVVTGRTECHWN